MGVKIKDIIDPRKIEISDLSNKILAVDSFNLLYQFLTTIRQADGTPLQDQQGNVTSHLVGLFARTTSLMKSKIKFVFVFDGKAPELKTKERERRSSIKKDAEDKYKIAMEKHDMAEMKKFASRISSLTPEMVEEAKALISALGLPIVQAPSEGEAQAAHMAKKGDVYGVVSQDGDSLLFKAPRLIKNLTLSQRRKSASKLAYERISPEIIDLDQTLNQLNFNQEQLIILAILIGTDYNIGGIKGIGPKKALKAINESNGDYDKMFEELKWSEQFDYSWHEIYDLIMNIPVTDDYELKWEKINPTKLKEILVDRHNFSQDRIDSVVEELNIILDSKQKDLSSFF